jgi:hypothetical protein
MGFSLDSYFIFFSRKWGRGWLIFNLFVTKRVTFFVNDKILTLNKLLRN